VTLSALYRYIPAIDSLRSYRFGHFRADLVAGRLHPKHIFREQPVRHTSTQMGVQYAYELIGTPLATDTSQALHYMI
jgi:hypothetical protein